MNANDDTPRNGESVTDVSDWESIGRELLQYQLEQSSAEVWEAFRQVAARVGRGEDVTAEELHQLNTAYENLGLAIESVEQVAVVEEEIVDDQDGEASENSR
jgi:hypothetical protein